MSTTDRRENVDAPAQGEGMYGPIRRAIRNSEIDLRVSAPATVMFTERPNIVTVSLGFLPVQSVRPQTQAAPDEQVLASTTIPNVRVAYQQGFNHYDIPPVTPGDWGALIFADRALDEWYRQEGLPVDPIDARAHDVADAVFVPGWMVPDSRQRPAPVNPAARVIEAPSIQLGETAVAPTGQVALAQALHTFLLNWLNAGVAIPQDGGVGLQNTMRAFLLANPFTQFSTTKVLAE